jgi:enoyl-CoA hydratase
VAYANLSLSIEDGIAKVAIQRPKVLNALNRETLTELGALFDELGANAEARGVLLTGAGDKAFVAGADINELSKMKALEAKELAYSGQQVLTKLERLGKPSVAMINGFALGGGLELALACTLRTMSTKARVGLPEVSLGIIPGYGGTQRLARIAGPAVAREWVLTGDMYGAEEALRVGVVNRIFEPAELEAGTLKLLRTILSRGPLAVRLALETIQRGLSCSQAEGEVIETDMFGLASTTEDMREGMSAFLEKRPPQFKGR